MLLYIVPADYGSSETLSLLTSSTLYKVHEMRCYKWRRREIGTVPILTLETGRL